MIESRYLKDSIENIQKLLTIPCLKSFQPQSVGKLLTLSKIREYKNGEIIIQEGGQDSWLYILLSGKVSIRKESHQISMIENAGEIFGEMRVIDSRERSASASAVGKAVCLAVDTNSKSRVSTDSLKEETLDFLLLLHRVFAEYMSIRLRAATKELIFAKKKIRHLISKI